MAWKGRIQPIMSSDKLKGILVDSGVQSENNPLFQTVDQMLDISGDLTKSLEGKLGKEDKINIAQQVEGRLPVSNGGVLPGIYTPLLTLVANVGGAGVDPTIWYRVGDYVIVSGKIVATPTAFNTLTQIGISLPVKSYFDFDYHLSGVAVCPTVRNECAAIYADIVNERAMMEWISGYNGVQNGFFYNFTYRIIQQ